MQSEKEIGLLIKHKRQQLQQSIQDAAKNANISFRIWSEVERGKPRAQINTILKICSHLDLELLIKQKEEISQNESLARVTPCIKTITPPFPQEIKLKRESLKLSQTEAANLVYKNRTTWARYEAEPQDNKAATPIDLGLWELFLIKTNLPSEE